MPIYYEADGSILCQSRAIMRHIGRKYNMYGETEAEKVLIDTVIDACGDLFRAYFTVLFTHKMEEPHLTEFRTKADGFMKVYESYLVKSKSGFIAGTSNISIADIELFDQLDTLLRSSPALIDNYEHLKAWNAKIRARPRIAEYMDAEPEHRKKGTSLG
jgi:glutathione S-transferase